MLLNYSMLYSFLQLFNSVRCGYEVETKKYHASNKSQYTNHQWYEAFLGGLDRHELYHLGCIIAQAVRFVQPCCVIVTDAHLASGLHASPKVGAA